LTVRKSGFFHVHDLSALRRENDHATTGLLNLLDQFNRNNGCRQAYEPEMEQTLFMFRVRNAGQGRSLFQLRY